MMFPRACTPIMFVLLLVACSPNKEKAADGIGRDGTMRITLPTRPAEPEQPPLQPEGTQWVSRPDGGMDFGVPGQPALLSIACSHGPDGRALIHLVRRTRAEAGAKALFALEGNMRVARVPMNVVRPGDPGEWQGSIDAHADSIGAIKGGNSVMATLPGGGMLRLTASREPGRLLEACRASDRGLPRVPA